MDPLTINGKHAGSREVLSGWKDIANYLGRGVRTVQRYEGEFKLPVRRPSGKPRSSVLAAKGELDRWVQSVPAREWPAMLKESPASPAFEVLSLQKSIQSLQKSIAQMKTLSSEAMQLRAEVRVERKTLTHNLKLVRSALALSNRAKSNVTPIETYKRRTFVQPGPASRQGLLLDWSMYAAENLKAKSTPDRSRRSKVAL